MTDIIIADGYEPPGGVITLQSHDRLRAAPGLTATIIGGAYIPATATGVTIDTTIKFAPPGDFAAAGVIQCAGPSAGIHCEIDCGGLPIQGVQLLRYPATAARPTGINLDGLHVYNNSLEPGDTTVGFNHGVYLENAAATTGTNMRFTDIRGGFALHFFSPDSMHAVTDSLFTRVTATRCFGDVIYWGALIERNHVVKLLSVDVGARGVINTGGGAPTGNTIDYVETPTTGYGWQPPVYATKAQQELRMAIVHANNALGFLSA